MKPTEIGKKHVGMCIEKGKKYWIRQYPTILDNKLYKVKIIDIVELGDGTKIVRYKSPFLSVEEMRLKDFEKHMVKWTTHRINYE